MTPGQTSLFNPNEGELLKERAIRIVEEHAWPRWKKDCLLSIFTVASGQRFLTTDDVWGMMEESPEVTHEPRAMGAMMRQAQVAGFIRATSLYQQSDRAVCHRRPLRVWESLIYEGWE